MGAPDALFLMREFGSPVVPSTHPLAGTRAYGTPDSSGTAAPRGTSFSSTLGSAVPRRQAEYGFGEHGCKHLSELFLLTVAHSYLTLRRRLWVTMMEIVTLSLQLHSVWK